MASGGSGRGGGGSGEQSDAEAEVPRSSISKGLLTFCTTGGEDFKRLLECPICLEFLVSPIYLCQTGHTICNSCKSEFSNCPSCEAPIGSARNFALESIVQTVSVFSACNHHHKGCKKFSKIQDLQEHLEECEFRPLKCHLSDLDNCNGTLLYLADTLGHLQDTHKLPIINSEEGHSNVFSSESSISFPDSDEFPDEDTRNYMWKGELFHFDENVFVSLMRSEGRLNCFGFYLIGPPEDASKYNVKISIQKKTLEDTIFKNEVTTQFTSIRDFQKVWKVWKLPDEAIVHRKALHRDKSTPKEVSVQEAKPKWGVAYTINRI